MGELFNEMLNPIAMERILNSLMVRVMESIEADMVNTVAKPAVEAIAAVGRENVKMAVNSTLVRDLTRASTEVITRLATYEVGGAVAKSLIGTLPRLVVRHLNSAIIPPLTLSIAPAVIRAVTRTRTDDLDCYYCKSGTVSNADLADTYCDRCKASVIREYTEDYYVYYYGK